MCGLHCNILVIFIFPCLRSFNVSYMAFVMVIACTMITIPFMLYGLELKKSGWTATYVALFGAVIASTDAASVAAVLRTGVRTNKSLSS